MTAPADRARRPLTAEQLFALDAVHGIHPPAPRPARAMLDVPLIDPARRELNLFSLAAIPGLVLGLLALPALWLVLAFAVWAEPHVR